MNRDGYRWSIAYENKGAPIVSVVSELERVREAAEGRPKPRDVVAAARPAMSPLHRFFLWDDTEAAERYRERQARDLLLNIVVMRAERDAVKEHTYSVEFFQAGAQPADGEATTRAGRPAAPAERALVDGARERVRGVFLEREADQVDVREERAWEELLSWQARYGGLPHFAEVTAAIARARARAAA